MQRPHPLPAAGGGAAEAARPAPAGAAEASAFAEFQKRLEPMLRAKGWWGRQVVSDLASLPDVIDSATPLKVVQLGSPRRLRTIYEANTRTAYAAGQWQRAQRTKALLPFFLYGLGPSERHRPHHEARRGLILPIDDPFWREWMPPNGWGCKCTVRQITGAEARRLGGPSERPEIPRRAYVNARTGEVTQIPEGIDPGWHTNPGLERYSQAANRLEAAKRRVRLFGQGEQMAAEALTPRPLPPELGARPPRRRRPRPAGDGTFASLQNPTGLSFANEEGGDSAPSEPRYLDKVPPGTVLTVEELIRYTKAKRGYRLEGGYVVDQDMVVLDGVKDETAKHVQITDVMINRLRFGPPISILHGHLVSAVPSPGDLKLVLMPGAGSHFAITGPDDEVLTYWKTQDIPRDDVSVLVDLAAGEANELMLKARPSLYRDKNEAPVEEQLIRLHMLVVAGILGAKLPENLQAMLDRLLLDPTTEAGLLTAAKGLRYVLGR